LLDKEGIKYEILEPKKIKDFFGLEIESFDCKHEEIYEDIFLVENTAFFINGKLFYPGDSFYNPEKSIEILALPVAGPWTNVKNAIDYALKINPKICFPVHDGMLKSFGVAHIIPSVVLEKFGIVFKNLEENKTEEF